MGPLKALKHRWFFRHSRLGVRIRFCLHCFCVNIQTCRAPIISCSTIQSVAIHSTILASSEDGGGGASPQATYNSPGQRPRACQSLQKLTFFSSRLFSARGLVDIVLPGDLGSRKSGRRRLLFGRRATFCDVKPVFLTVSFRDLVLGSILNRF